jgi:hypothetical protein
MLGCIRKEHREYTSRMEEWQEKLHRAAGAVVLGHEEAAETVSEERKWPAALGHLHALPPERLRFPYPELPSFLFHYYSDPVYTAVDALNQKYGKYTVYWGSSFPAMIQARHEGERGDIPERQTNLLRGETRRRRLGLPFLGEVK